jgi:hypothetical protein
LTGGDVHDEYILGMEGEVRDAGSVWGTTCAVDCVAQAMHDLPFVGAVEVRDA